MRIERQGTVERSRSSTVQGSGTKSVASGKTGSVMDTDQVVVSAEARLLQEALGRLRKLPEVRQGLIDSLAQKLAEGYTVEARKVAQSIMEEMTVQR